MWVIPGSAVFPSQNATHLAITSRAHLRRRRRLHEERLAEARVPAGAVSARGRPGGVAESLALGRLQDAVDGRPFGLRVRVAVGVAARDDRRCCGRRRRRRD